MTCSRAWRAIARALALTAIATVTANIAPAQRGPTSRGSASSLTVLVRDTTGAPIDGAEVAIPLVGIAGRTDASGQLIIGPLRGGAYVVIGRRFGFLPDSQQIRLVSGTPGRVTLQLRTSAQLLDTALVESEALRDKMVDFERRRASGRGTFITRDDIERRNPLVLADMLRSVRGLSLRNAGGRTELRFVRANARLDGVDCPPDVWVDGVRAFGATVDEFSPAEIEGLELYRGLGQMPAEYLSRTSGCGLVIIWTRSPSRITR